jgi:hypothetical protein
MCVRKLIEVLLGARIDVRKAEKMGLVLNALQLRRLNVKRESFLYVAIGLRNR